MNVSGDKSKVSTMIYTSRQNEKLGLWEFKRDKENMARQTAKQVFSVLEWIFI
jgi:hypothetical protein